MPAATSREMRAVRVRAILYRRGAHAATRGPEAIRGTPSSSLALNGADGRGLSYSQRMASAKPIFAARRAGNQQAANTVANRMTTIARR